MTITIRPSWNFLCIIKNSTLPTSWHNKGIFAISQCIWKLKLFYLKSNSDITCFWLSLFNRCISTCFLFTSVGWCNVPVHLKFIHKDKLVWLLKNAKCLMCGFLHMALYFNLFTIYRAFIGFMLCHTTSNLPPNCSNRAFFIRLLPSLVLSVRRKKARWSECPGAGVNMLGRGQITHLVKMCYLLLYKYIAHWLVLF